MKSLVSWNSSFDDYDEIKINTGVYKFKHCEQYILEVILVDNKF